MTNDADLIAALQAENALLRQRVAALEQSESRLRQLFAKLTDVVLVMDANGRYCDILAGDPCLLYRPARELLGKTLHEVLPQERADEFLSMIHQSLATQKPVSVEYCLPVPAGDVWFTGHISPLDPTTILFTIYDITQRKQAEAALQRRDAILEVVNRIAEQLLTATDWHSRIADVLACLGLVTDANQVSIFQNHHDADGILRSRQRDVWRAAGTTPQMHTFLTCELPLHDTGFASWEEILSSNQVIAGHRSQFPPAIQDYLSVQGITSVMLVPIFVGNVWWGFMSFLTRHFGREWTTIEIDALRVAVNILGATILRQQAEHAFRSVFENAPIGIFRITLDGKFLVVNPAFAHVLGYASAQELIDTVPNATALYIDPTRRPELVKTILASEGSACVENHFYHRNGSAIVARLNVWVARDDQGMPLYLEGFIEDITLRTRMEAEQRLNEDRLESLYRLSQMKVCSDQEIIGYALEEGVRLTSSKIGYLHFVNDDQVSLNLFTWSKDVNNQCTAVRTSHYPLESAGVWVDCVRERRPIIHNDYQNLPHKRGYPTGHIHIIRHMNIPVFDGDKIVAVAGVGNKATPYDEADVRQLYLFMNDMWVILERKRAEERVRMSEERYRTLISASPDAITGTDLQGNITFESPVSLRMYGFEQYQDLPGRNILDFIIPEDHARAIAGMQQMLNGVHPGVSEYRALKADGTVFDLEVNGEVIRDVTGNPTGMVFISRDITERKRIEHELAVKSADLEQALLRSCALAAAAEAANRAKSVFLANMSHELRTPLNAILGFTQLMSYDPNLSEEQQENLEIMLHSGEHLLDLINDVLDLSKIEAGRMTLQEQDFDLLHLLAGLEEMFQLRAMEKGLSLVVELGKRVPGLIHADMSKLRQVLINLLGNAIKFTSHGKVTLRVWTNVDHLDVLYVDEYQITFEVEDTGLGISREDLKTVFDPFVQAESDDQARDGTGLGLSISQQFVRLMGGELTANSTIGKGSIFRFTLPIRAADVVSQALDHLSRQVVGLAPGQSRYRLLVVEDQEPSRKLLVKLLTSLGFDVREAINGQEAVDIWARWSPHLIWMDMRMPVMDGYEATRRIKATTQGQATVIIALTASVFDGERAMILSQGCDDFLRKPFRQSDILDVLTRHLGVRFEYAERPPTAVVPTVPSVDDEAMLSMLAHCSPDWLAELRQATIAADLNQMLNLIAVLRSQNGSLAGTLEDLVHKFEHDTILHYIEHATQWHYEHTAAPTP